MWDLAQVLRKTWSAAVAERFPDRRFDVDVNDDSGPTLTVRSAYL
jgi:hypothetical protein